MNGVQGGSQNWVLFQVWDENDAALSGDAPNLTMTISRDGVDDAADNPPQEIGTTGAYQLQLSVAESTGVFGVKVAGVSSTPGARVIATEIGLLAGADIKALLGSGQSATDLQDFADEGYDPDTNKVQGVVLVDTTTDVANDVSVTGTVTIDAASVAAIWNEPQAGYTTSGTFGFYLDAAVSASSGSSATDIADAILSRNVSLTEDTYPQFCLGTTILANLNSIRNDGTGAVDVFKTTGLDLFSFNFTASDVNPLTGIGLQATAP